MIGESAQGGNTRALADNIIRSSPSSSPFVAIHSWVRQNIPYIPDPEDWEALYNPEALAHDVLIGKHPGGDCDDHAMLVAALGCSININSRVVIADTDFDGEYDHAWAQLESPYIGWINVDTTVSYPLGWEYNYGKVAYVTPG